MMLHKHTRRPRITVLLATLMLSAAGCGGGLDETPQPATANAYILPNARSLADKAFGSGPVVIYVGERLRLINLDDQSHVVVADSPDATDFRQSAELPANGGEQSFVMTKSGTTLIRSQSYPQVSGTLVVMPPPS